MSNTNPLVSIVIPVYNGSNYLKDAIDSALAQSYNNIEVIVVNDGSTDGGKTEKVAKSYGKKIRYYTKKNQGVASALNMGIKTMKGMWFSWLSHDDVYNPEKISEQIKFAIKNPEAKIIYSNYELVNESLNHLHYVSVESDNSQDMAIRLLHSYPLNGCAMLISKDCFEKEGLFDADLQTTQDYEMWFRLALTSQFHLCKINAIKSRQHSLQGSHGNNHKEEVDKLYVYFLSKVTSEKLTKAFGNEAGNWLLKLARIYKNRGYIEAPREALRKATELHSVNKLSYVYTKYYCKLPNNLVSLVADIRHHIERIIFQVHGIINNLITKLGFTEKDL